MRFEVTAPPLKATDLATLADGMVYLDWKQSGFWQGNARLTKGMWREDRAALAHVLWKIPQLDLRASETKVLQLGARSEWVSMWFPWEREIYDWKWWD